MGLTTGSLPDPMLTFERVATTVVRPFAVVSVVVLLLFELEMELRVTEHRCVSCCRVNLFVQSGTAMCLWSGRSGKTWQ